MDFASAKYDVADAFAANELYQDNGWTDGLPIVPPTDALVRTFLEAARMAPGDVVAAEPVCRRRITVSGGEKGVGGPITGFMSSTLYASFARDDRLFCGETRTPQGRPPKRQISVRIPPSQRL